MSIVKHHNVTRAQHGMIWFINKTLDMCYKLRTKIFANAYIARHTNLARAIAKERIGQEVNNESI